MDALSVSARREKRLQVRELRRALTSTERERAAARLHERVAALDVYRSAERIAGYLAFDGEMDIGSLLRHASASGKQVLLPILPQKDAPKILLFAPYEPGARMRTNYFGILEPDVSSEQYIDAARIDLVLTPLVAFDGHGNRIGVGGGFYDRTFSFLLNSAASATSKPCLVGVAYDMQRVEAIVREPWDVPLSAVATERCLYPAADGIFVE